MKKREKIYYGNKPFFSGLKKLKLNVLNYILNFILNMHFKVHTLLYLWVKKLGF